MISQERELDGIFIETKRGGDIPICMERTEAFVGPKASFASNDESTIFIPVSCVQALRARSFSKESIGVS